MKRLNVLAAVILAGLGAWALLSQAGDMPGMPGMKAHQHEAGAATVHAGRGLVNAVDVKRGVVNLTHEAIPSLGWPGMTMDFTVKDASVLASIKPGMKVEFDLEKTATGYRISRLAPVKE